MTNKEVHTEQGNDRRQYPGAEPQPNEPQWKKMVQYGITGWMSSWYGINRVEFATAFGGYFKANTEDEIITGQMVDPHGMSVIEGELRRRKGELFFLKTYIDSNGQGLRSPIEYYFEKRDKLWVGEFYFGKSEQEIKGVKKGRAEASLVKFHDNASGILTSL